MPPRRRVAPPGRRVQPVRVVQILKALGAGLVTLLFFAALLRLQAKDEPALSELEFARQRVNSCNTYAAMAVELVRDASDGFTVPRTLASRTTEIVEARERLRCDTAEGDFRKLLQAGHDARSADASASKAASAR
jgi:hypothetical protein